MSENEENNNVNSEQTEDVEQTEEVEQAKEVEREEQEKKTKQNGQNKRAKSGRKSGKSKDVDGGVVYILTNPSFPDYVKLGFASDLESRLNSLNQTECTPFAFRVYATYEVGGNLADIDLHDIIDGLNPSLRAIENLEGKQRKREFYAMSAKEAYDLLCSIARLSGTLDKLHLNPLEGQEKQDEETADEIQEETINRRAENFSFLKCGIKPGEEIVFLPDSSIVATVVDERHVSYNDKIWYLSPLTKELLHVEHPVQGTQYWKYNGRLLSDIRGDMNW